MYESEKNGAAPEQVGGKITITYDPETNGTAYTIEGMFPRPMLVNVLEMLKAQMIGAQFAEMAKAAQQQAQRQHRGRVLMPDGSPAP